MFPQTVDRLYGKHIKLNGIGLFNASVITFSLFWIIWCIFLGLIWRRRASAQKETQSCAKQNIFTRTKDWFCHTLLQRHEIIHFAKCCFVIFFLQNRDFSWSCVMLGWQRVIWAEISKWHLIACLELSMIEYNLELMDLIRVWEGRENHQNAH